MERKRRMQERKQDVENGKPVSITNNYDNVKHKKKTSKRKHVGIEFGSVIIGSPLKRHVHQPICIILCQEVNIMEVELYQIIRNL